MDFLWDRAVRQAELDVRAWEGNDTMLTAVAALRGTACPVTLDTLLSDPAEPALLVERIEQAMRG